VEALKAARSLQGEELSPAAIESAAETAARDEMDPRGDVHATPEFKRHLARVLTRRVLRLATERARSGGSAA
jgi:CO/xanthine dehydrogenase FAD-binding subunit